MSADGFRHVDPFFGTQLFPRRTRLGDLDADFVGSDLSDHATNPAVVEPDGLPAFTPSKNSGSDTPI